MGKKYNRISALTLISSCACNLNCAYCMMAKNPNNKLFSSQLQEKTIQALKDGTFLENTKKVIQKLGATTPSEITHLEFWGQEPTLTLELFSEKIKDWLAVYPNICEYSFSTNGVANIDKIVEFIKVVNDTSKLKAQIQFQMSWDGDFSTESLRNLNKDVVLNNFKLLITELNKLILNNCTVSMTIHGVITRQLIEHLDSVEKVQNFYLSSCQRIHDIAILNANKSVHIHENFDLGWENPMPASQDDGIQFCNFFKRGLTLNKEQFFSNEYPPTQLIKFVKHVPSNLKVSNIKDADKIILDLLNKTNQNFSQQLDQMSRQIGCGPFVGVLKIMYDGTLLICQNFMFDRFWNQNDELAPDVNTQIRQNLNKFKFFINPLDDSYTDKDFENMFGRFEELKTTSFLYTYYQVLILMYYLALSKQIDISYSIDYNKLIRHAFIITYLQQCPYNNIIMTGSLFNRDSGLIRWYCNGILDEIEKMEILNGCK